MSLKQETLTFDRMKPWCAETGVNAKELLEDGLTLLSVSASACCGRTEVLKEEILAEGTVTFCALLRTREGDVRSLTRTERFSFSKFSVTGTIRSPESRTRQESIRLPAS